MKNLYRKCPVFFNLFFVLAFMLSFGSCAMAATSDPALASTDSTSLFDLLSVIIGSEVATKFISVCGLLCFIFTHVRAWIPASWLAKLPTGLVKLIEKCSGNYFGAKNEREISNNSTNHIL